MIAAFCTCRLQAQSAPAPAASTEGGFARGSWQLELSGEAAPEAWDYNLSHETLYGIVVGLGYAVRDGFVVAIAAPAYGVSQRGPDGVLLGGAAGVRGRLHRGARSSIFWELGLGGARATVPVPPGGTRFNYLVLAGAGATVGVHAGLHLVAGLQWIHLSNNSLAGRNRNPDLQAVGLRVGLLWSLSPNAKG